MGSYPAPVLLFCCVFVLAAVWAQQTEIQEIEDTAFPPSDCREETYPCTRMYSVHRPTKRCIQSLCLYSLPRVYVINKEICVRTVCQQDELLMAELCRERSGWPKRQKRTTKRRCLRDNPKTWANREIQEIEDTAFPPSDCREETYPCTRMYSVHRPTKRCIQSLCLYSLPRVYVINKEICVRTVCQQDELLMAELCRERSGWPKRQKRTTKRRCLRDNPKTWANRG